MEDSLIELYCLVDEFIPLWHKHLLENKLKKRCRQSQLNMVEIMTICSHFHQSHYRNFKYYCYVTKYFKRYVPRRVSDQRFIALMKSVIFIALENHCLCVHVHFLLISLKAPFNRPP